ncbi:YdeI/OmpD-associated family protein [Psychroserpens sp.]|uniref:YdeI/OmpD-associated family protein n=1 Tax=Psychroserpens sp. TaxID=2020870 RepID=UPI001B14E06A|nr:YdeI/OmpD-associated family protein [Psychroserpens sp.]MBO6607207.1 YdeI/OmpD-associated family protein [Psychroserpens sp.]MBO6630787.1 YdeI/OmpD-associated family protein [Psychroserpens sp.]MBO6654353.1 YdeI/OmpD-associated family protein [Psychroserpens sp.]MBO6682361.1 YdeI/OmpD-associated family protein [Psychroserpens sp.]MBO6750979.1 YdeI/OmpD-associated family protein [Psychroserpens sp.]
MAKVTSVDEYIERNSHFGEALELLRSIISKTELEETIKWSAPVYALDGKNVVGLGAFKNHFGVWFFNGVFLKDEQNLLINAQENKTKALRQMRFKSIDDINESAVLSYVKEAIENQRLGKEIKPERKSKTVEVPDELKAVFKSDTALQNAFKALTPGKQREYCEHVSSAKREATKLSRIEKITPMILQGLGLYDKYKNC